MRLARHAKRRMRERGISRREVKRVLKYGRPQRGRGGTQYWRWLGVCVVIAGKNRGHGVVRRPA